MKGIIRISAMVLMAMQTMVCFGQAIWPDSLLIGPALSATNGDQFATGVGLPGLGTANTYTSPNNFMGGLVGVNPLTILNNGQLLVSNQNGYIFEQSTNGTFWFKNANASGFLMLYDTLSSFYEINDLSGVTRFYFDTNATALIDPQNNNVISGTTNRQTIGSATGSTVISGLAVTAPNQVVTQDSSVLTRGYGRSNYQAASANLSNWANLNTNVIGSGGTDTNALHATNNLSDVVSASASRANLGAAGTSDDNTFSGHNTFTGANDVNFYINWNSGSLLQLDPGSRMLMYNVSDGILISSNSPGNVYPHFLQSLPFGSFQPASANLSNWANLSTNVISSTDTNAFHTNRTLTPGQILVGNTISNATAVSATGDVTINSNGVTALKATGTAGTYFKSTYDAQGRETSGSNPTTLAGFGITDAQATNANLTGWASQPTNAVGISGTFSGNGGGLSNLFVSASNAVFVSKLGNDSTGTRGNASLPFLTLTAAKTASQSGDTIFVYPGVYTDNNILKNGVTWQFSGPSCVVSNVANNNIASTTNAILDDFGGTVTNFNVLGYPTFYYFTGTNNWGYDAVNDIPTGIGATNAYQAISITNALTTGRVEIYEIKWASWQNATPVQSVLIANCSNLDLDIRQFTDVYFGNNYTYVSSVIGPIVFTPASSGFVWDLGNGSLNFNKIGPFEQYGIWCNEIGAGAHTNNFYFTGNELNQKIYVSAVSKTYRSWFNINWINTTNATAAFAADFFGGFNYLRAMKVSDTVVGAVNVTAGANVWLDIQKVSSPTKWINVQSASSNAVFAQVQQYEDLGSVANGIIVTGGTNFIQGGTATTLNGSVPSLTGGSTTFTGFNLNGSNWTTGSYGTTTPTFAPATGSSNYLPTANPTATGTLTVPTAAIATETVGSLTVTNGLTARDALTFQGSIASGNNLMPFDGAQTAALASTETNKGLGRADGVMGIKLMIWEYTRTTSTAGANTNVTDYIYTNGVFYKAVSLFTGDGSTITFTNSALLNLVLPSPYTNCIMNLVSNNSGVAIGNSWLKLSYELTNSTASW